MSDYYSNSMLGRVLNAVEYLRSGEPERHNREVLEKVCKWERAQRGILRLGGEKMEEQDMNIERRDVFDMGTRTTEMENAAFISEVVRRNLAIRDLRIERVNHLEADVSKTPWSGVDLIVKDSLTGMHLFTLSRVVDLLALEIVVSVQVPTVRIKRPTSPSSDDSW